MSTFLICRGVPHTHFKTVTENTENIMKFVWEILDGMAPPSKSDFASLIAEIKNIGEMKT